MLSRLPGSGRRIAAIAAISISSAVFGRTELRWYRAATPEVTILTTLSEKRAIERANEFSQYVAALRAYFGPTTGGNLAPLTMVVFDRDRDFREYLPLGKDGKPQALGGFFVRHESWAIIGLSAETSRDARHVIFHEGVHWFLNGSDIWLPPWLDEGMAEVFSTFEVRDNVVRWGREVTANLNEVRRMGLVPVRRLFYTGRDDLFKDDAATTVFYAESWLFVHYLIFGKNKLPHDGINRYAALMLSGTDPDQAFNQVFGTYVSMDRQLAAYMRAGTYHLSRRPLVPTPAVSVKPASRQEVDEALGRLALVSKKYDRAIECAKSMVARAPNDPRGHALLGLALKESGQVALAPAEFEIAAKDGTLDFQPYFEVASALQDGNVMISADGARKAADYYEKAIALRPGHEASYTNLGGVISAADPIRPTDRLVLEDGARRFPKNAIIALGLAQLTRIAGDRTAARNALRAVMAWQPAPPQNALAYAHRIQSTWEDEEFLEELRKLADEGKYQQALDRLDWRATAAGGSHDPGEFADLRRQYVAATQVQEFNALLVAQDWPAARALASKILDSDAPALVKTEIRRVLSSLGR